VSKEQDASHFVAVADWERRQKSDPEKLALAARLRGETTLTMKWIAARLHGDLEKSPGPAPHPEK
jgi:hypothetical protein